jgi:hypothetical protein
MYGYLYPFYRSPFINNYGPGYNPYYGGDGSYNPYNYSHSYYNSNVIGSAIANQTMNTIGAEAIGDTQIANPTVIW